MISNKSKSFDLKTILEDIEMVIKHEGNLDMERLIITKDEFKFVKDGVLWEVTDYKKR